ncbi:hypothetical protein HAZT_HAZT008203 [Hyalella azteca]|uniref:Uncharacterized protein LOC108671656 n=1 Tax=Hyalella azteca TaxID=294128 RepID=A0A6A0H0B8_HYAAZ|nr:uncharacterized protein LOC108671656 [Hyalella azteca]KAA0194807.1 hypothetical protein HAZT_HAZT008203 [Hyalella azteca]
METINNKLEQNGLQPITKQNILYYYIPMDGCVGFVILGSQMLSPEFYSKFKFLMIPRTVSLTNACLGTSLLGSALYISSRSHMKSLPISQKISYSILGSSLLNLGSVLGWALCRSWVSGDDSAGGSGVLLRAVAGGVAAAGVITLARSYLNFVDDQISKAK